MWAWTKKTEKEKTAPRIGGLSDKDCLCPEERCVPRKAADSL